jgi:ribonuclease P protein component
MTRYTFPGDERLKDARLITELFETGKSFLIFPVKVVWMESLNAGSTPAKVVFTVSKRSFKHAVMRNLLKRRMREAYRLNRAVFTEENSRSGLLVAFVYIAREELPYSVISKSMKNALKRLRMSVGQVQ